MAGTREVLPGIRIAPNEVSKSLIWKAKMRSVHTLPVLESRRSLNTRKQSLSRW